MSELADLRSQIEELFRDPSDLDAFLLDYFPEVYRHSSHDRDRTARITRLLAEEEADKIREVLQNHRLHRGRKGCQTVPASLTPTTVLSVRPDGNIHWSGVAPSRIVQHAWGAPCAANGQPVDLQCYWRFLQQQSLSRTLLRLALHGGVRDFAARGHRQWFEKHTAELNDCMGLMTEQNWRAAPSGSGNFTGWHFSEVSDGASFDPTQLAGSSHSVSELSDLLNTQMNLWVLEQLDAEIESVMHGDSRRHPGPTYHQQYLEWMQLTWPRWRRALHESPQLLQHVLSCLLMPPDASSEHAGLLRAGPRTVKLCLLPAVVFALIIDAVLDPTANLAPRQWSHPPGNFDLQGQDTQLVGLQIFNGQQLATMLMHRRQMWVWNTKVVLLPHETRSLTRLRDELNNQRRIGTPPNHLERFTRKLHAEVLLTQDEQIRDLLEQPPAELRQHITGELEALRQMIDRDVAQAVNKAVKI